ncbi:MAG TPA: MATE family efflux transporter, partial [Planctomycetota bacterium]|nr:MATE family efflux transporter [Planctomycetota bacterium]
MSLNAGALPGDAPPRESPSSIGVASVLRLAWPAVLSYLLANAYRINDQYWIQGLGAEAQDAVGGTVFVVIMNFSVVFLAAGGTLALVARATGARDPKRRDALIASACALAGVIWIALAVVGSFATPSIVEFLGLRGAAATFATDYLRTLYVCALPLVVAPALDHALIGMGNTLLMSVMELCAVLLHYFLAPALIYGARAAELADHPGARFVGHVAGALGLEGHGIAGAAWSAALARTLSVSVGLFVLHRWYGVRLLDGFKTAWRTGGRTLLALDIARISLPMSLSIALYASVYWALIKWVVVPLGNHTLAALGIGFAVFEGVSFPIYFGIAMSGASLVGRALGAGNTADALAAVRSVRILAVALGTITMIVFLTCAERWADSFSDDPIVQREVAGYVFVLAFSQVFVAFESA